MPTYRLTERTTGRIVDAAVQADSEYSARANQPDDLDLVVIEISPNPPAAVYTIAWPQETARGVEMVEVLTTGSRATALRELAKEPADRVLIEESPAVNRQQARGRRS